MLIFGVLYYLGYHAQEAPRRTLKIPLAHWIGQ